MAKLTEGDTVGLTGEVTRINDDGAVTVRLHGFGTPITLRAEHLSLVAKKGPNSKRRKPLFDKPD
jgi:preprotein translocase subunit YajC